ncbi:MAG: hypothetical protein WCW77_03735 [Patescibacteria group bacterium]|jgi:hypothetical protein
MEISKTPFSKIKPGGRFYLSEKSAAIGEYCTKFPEPVVKLSECEAFIEAASLGADGFSYDSFNAIHCLGWFVGVPEDKEVIPSER